MTVHEVYNGSNAADTRRLMRRLEGLGIIGKVAASLFRAQKASARAKKYKGGIDRGDYFTSYTSLAYENKAKAIDALCRQLAENPECWDWGWGRDKDAGFNMPEHVLYVDLPCIGQVSFHSTHRFVGPDYRGEWDGIRGVSADRIIAFCERALVVYNEPARLF